MPKRRINCPQCGHEILYDTVADVPTFPFCSDRCRLVDLDKWFEEEYRVSQDIKDDAAGERDVPGAP